MAITQIDLDRLERALMSGTLTVEYDGSRVTYASVAELKSAIAYAKSALSAATGSVQPIFRPTVFSRG